MSEKVRKDKNRITKMEANKDRERKGGGATGGLVDDYYVKTVSKVLI